MMKDYLRLDAANFICGHQQTPDELPVDLLFEEQGEVWVLGPEVNVDLFGDFKHRYDSDMGAIVATDVPTIPTPPFIYWDEHVGQWIDPRDLEQHKLDKWQELKANRDAEEFSSFTWDGNEFQCDDLSQRRLQGAILQASLDDAVSIEWTLLDNSAITLSALQLTQVGMALAAHVDACHIKARGLRVQVDAATSLTDLNAINW